MIQIGRREVRLPSESEVRQFAAAFARDHFIRAPQLIDPELFDPIADGIQSAEYRLREDDDPGTDLRLVDHRLDGALVFLLSDPAIFTIVERVTACPPIRSFVGSVFRMDAGAHYDEWHDDIAEGRVVALSLNVSRRPYNGGTLQIRRTGETAIVREVPNRRYGDAVLFRIAEDLEHRVTPVAPGPPRIAFAGWFRTTAPAHEPFLAHAPRASHDFTTQGTEDGTDRDDRQGK